MNSNTVYFSGGIYPEKYGEDSFDLAFSAGGMAYLRFKVSSYAGQDQQGESKPKINWGCVAFGDLAENIAESVKPGDQVMVAGAIENQNWTDENNDDRTVVKQGIVVRDLGLSLIFDTASSDKMWSDKGDEKPKKKGKKKGKKSSGKVKRTDYGPNEAPFSGASS